MKFKRFFALALTLAFLASSFVIFPTFNAAEGDFQQRKYTIPQTLKAPAIDGVMSDGEWTGAYHYFINYDEGAQWYGTWNGDFIEGIIQDKDNACTGWDIYIQWVQGGDEATYGEGDGGLYFSVIGHDSTRFNAPVYGTPLNASVDAIQLAIDPLNTEHPADRFLYDFAPYSKGESGEAGDCTGPATCYEHEKYSSDPSKFFEIKKASVLTENDYTMEFFIPWYALQIETGNDLLMIDRTPGTEFGLGLILMDWVGSSPYYFALDFGQGSNLNESLGWPDLYNKVTLGGLETSADVSLNSTVAEVGKEITAYVELDSTKVDLGGILADLKYDNTALELVSTEAQIIESSQFVAFSADGEDGPIAVNTNYGGTNNTIRFTAIDLRDGAANTSGTLMKVKFKVLKPIEEFPALQLSLEAADKSANELVVGISKAVVSDILKGDVDANGKVELSDAMKSFQHVAGKITLTGDAFEAADINRNSLVALDDAMKIFQCVAGKITVEQLQNF